jgi:hypothetical protein
VNSGTQKGGQALSQGMNDAMCHVLGAGTELKHRKNLRTRIDGQPQPGDLLSTAQPRAQFVQLHMRELEVAERVLVQLLSVRASASQPRGDGGLMVAEDAGGRGNVQSFGQSSEHHGDLLRRGFQAVHGGIASSTEGGAARLTTKGLDALGMTILAIANQSVLSSVSVAKVGALPVRTSEALGVDAFRGSPPAFNLETRGAPAQAPALQPTRQGRQDDRRGNRLGSAA